MKIRTNPVKASGPAAPPPNDPGNPRGTPEWLQLSKFEILALAFAVLIAHGFYFNAVKLPILHDAAGYLRAAQDIVRNGLFSKFELSEIRAYGWPFLLSLMVRVSGVLGVSIRLFALEVLLLAHLAMCLCLRQAVRACELPRGADRLVFVSLALNPLVLIYPAYLLSESAAFSLIIAILAAAAWRISPVGKRHPYRIAALGSLALGYSIMVRPGNVCLLPVWAAALGIAFFLHREERARRARQAVWALLILAVPFVPQVYNNARFYGAYTPLLVNSYGSGQWWLGIRWLKLSGSHIEGQSPLVYYWNPFYDGKTVPYENPLPWYAEHPAQGAVTTALHVFDLLNQDLPLPYNPTLTPWYYPADALANMFVVACGVMGMILSVRFALRQGRTAIALHAIATLTLLCLIGMHSMMAIELRWGVPSLMILYVFAAWLWFAYLPRAPLQRRAIVLSAAALTSAFSYPLSAWVRQQSPAIRVAEAAARPVVPPELAVSKPFISGSLDHWSLLRAGVSPAGEAVLFTPAAGAVSLIQHPVRLSRSTMYVVEFEARVDVPGEINVDLYAGPGYDRQDQNTVFSLSNSTYQRFTAEWNSGADAPEQAELRFATVSRSPIRIRGVSFRNATMAVTSGPD